MYTLNNEEVQVSELLSIMYGLCIVINDYIIIIIIIIIISVGATSKEKSYCL